MMTTFKKQIIGVVSTGLIVANLLSPALVLGTNNSNGGTTSIEISGNGAYSENEAKVKSENETTVVQSNKAIVNNYVDATANSGGNTSSLNTGGDVLIRTGDAKSGVSVENVLNTNKATVDCCRSGDTTVKIDGNGAYSENEVKLKLESENEIFQDNYANVRNDVDSTAKSGGNDASLNTGGNTTIHTGDATSVADVSTKANANFAQIGGPGQNSGSLTALLVGNGAFSDSDIRVYLDNDNVIAQDNYARVYNDVDSKAKTGLNTADLNTGGDVLILTGDARSLANVDNKVNFNWADIDCGCLLDVNAKIAGNGAFAEDEIKLKLDGDTEVFQGGKKDDGNFADLMNYVDGIAKSGKNESELNTGPVVGDPNWTLTGDATSLVGVDNSGNVNVFGSSVPADWPDMGIDFGFSLGWWNWWNSHLN